MANTPKPMASPFTQELYDYLEGLAAAGCIMACDLLRNYRLHRHTYMQAVAGGDNCRTSSVWASANKLGSPKLARETDVQTEPFRKVIPQSNDVFDLDTSRLVTADEAEEAIAWLEKKISTIRKRRKCSVYIDKRKGIQSDASRRQAIREAEKKKFAALARKTSLGETVSRLSAPNLTTNPARPR